MFRSPPRWCQIGTKRLLLLVLVVFPAIGVGAGNEMAERQKMPTPIAAPYANPTEGLGAWIWAGKTADNQTCQLWHTFEIPKEARVSRARLAITADNAFTLYLDGRELGRGTEWRELYLFELAQLLNPGLHVLAVTCYNGSSDAGLLCGLRIVLEDGRIIEVKSDQSWRIVPEGVSKWARRREALPDWPAATIIAPLGGLAPLNGTPWAPAPDRVDVMPTLQPIKVFFWQTGWFQITLLISGGFAILLVFRLMAQLALHQNEQRLLQKERARIAREIHDDIGARMTQLVLDGEEAQSELTADSQMQLRLNHICDEARGLLATMDEILWAVNPQRDTLRDFAAQVCKYVQRCLRATPIQCRLEVEPSLSAAAFSLPLRRSLFMAIKEALNNAIKYSAATELRLKIEWQNQRLVVAVADNGQGFDPKSVTPDRNGLTNMAQRMSEIGGSCVVTSQPGQGCRVEFSVPLNRRRRWAWIWNADQFSEQMKDSRNNLTNNALENNDPTKF